ncbi:hypothetical protein SHJG_1456 [Streptomyces hygroscopicus subsp. jinggangensis 5008]|nr:hypothetical protein SHJG_1456 [Streptomyces hygroscopicus subsp. jinggangensis 5008]AGF60954.1 hypothetical protein SHJGH_1288 [Streptomyces hygroscopicus subsp. jinggangensis TL01]
MIPRRGSAQLQGMVHAYVPLRRSGVRAPAWRSPVANT